MCSCIAKVTARPPLTRAHTHTSVSWLTLTLLNSTKCVLLRRPWDKDIQMSSANIFTTSCSWGTRAPIPAMLSCFFFFTFCSRFTDRACDSLTAARPRCQELTHTQLPHTDQETRLSPHPHQLAASLLLEVGPILITFLCVPVCVLRCFTRLAYDTNS